jgi:hypothetical protein
MTHNARCSLCLAMHLLKHHTLVRPPWGGSSKPVRAAKVITLGTFVQTLIPFLCYWTIITSLNAVAYAKCLRHLPKPQASFRELHRRPSSDSVTLLRHYPHQLLLEAQPMILSQVELMALPRTLLIFYDIAPLFPSCCWKPMVLRQVELMALPGLSSAPLQRSSSRPDVTTTWLHMEPGITHGRCCGAAMVASGGGC